MTDRTVLVRSGADLGVALAEARKAHGLTQVQAAARTGVARVYLAKLEAGMSVALLERALRVLRRLDAQVIVELPDRVINEPQNAEGAGRARAHTEPARA